MKQNTAMELHLIMTHKQELDELIPHKERQDWKGLRKQLKKTGIRNSTLMALMPAETVCTDK